MDSFKKHISNTFWLSFGHFYSMGLHFLGGVLIARHLGPADYGMMNYAISLVVLFSILATLGLDNVLVKEFSNHEDSPQALMGSSMCLKALGCCIMLIALWTFFRVFLFEESSVEFLPILIYSIGFLFSSANTFRCYFESQEKGRLVAIPQIFQATLIFALYLVCVFLCADYITILAVNAAHMIILFLVYIPILNKSNMGVKTWVINGQTMQRLISVSWPYIFSVGAVLVYQRIDQVMLMKMASAEDVGVYSVAVRVCNVVFVFPGLLGRVFFPSLLRAKERNEMVYLKRVISFFSLLLWISIVVAVVLSVLARPMVSVIFGDSYNQSAKIVVLLAWKSVFFAMGLASSYWILAANLQKYVPIRSFVGCVLNIILNLQFITMWGARGAATATLVSTLVSCWLVHAFIKPLRSMFWMQCRSLITGPLILFSEFCSVWRKMREKTTESDS